MQALLENQGLRAPGTDTGGVGAHRIIGETIGVQLDSDLGLTFDAMRLMRHGNEYPTQEKQRAGDQDAADAIAFADKMIRAVETLIPLTLDFR